MYGLINNITSAEDQRYTLVGILLEKERDMLGCLSYIVATDAEDPNGVWVTEVWNDQADQKAFLEMATVKDATRRAAPTIASFQSRTITIPIGGQGLPES